MKIVETIYRPACNVAEPSNFSLKYGKWERRFLTSFLFCPEGDVGKSIQQAVFDGLVPNDYPRLCRLAEDIGTLFSYAFIKGTGGERKAEELNIPQISLETGIETERLSVALLVARGKFIKSQADIDKRNEHAGFRKNGKPSLDNR
jgi:hypothetical protein